MEKKFLLDKTKNDLFRNILKNDITIINRYLVFRKLFYNDDLYLFFAEPNIIDKLKTTEWYTSVNVQFIDFTRIPSSLKDEILGILSRFIKEIFLLAFREIEEGRSDWILFDYLETAIEIPDFDKILLAKLENNKTLITLVNWGSNYVEFGSPSGIIRRLVPIYIRDICFSIVYKNGKPAINEEIEFEFANDWFRKKNKLPIFNHVNRNVVLKSNNLAKIKLYDISFFSTILTYCNIRGQKRYLQEFECRAQGDEHFIIRLPYNGLDYRLFVKEENRIVAGVDLKLIINGAIFDLKSKSEGEILAKYNVNYGDTIFLENPNSELYSLLTEKIILDNEERLAVEIKRPFIDEKVKRNKVIDDLIEKKKKQLETANPDETKSIETEIERLERIKKSDFQGQSGVLRINLAWDTEDDLDLHLVTPNGIVGFDNKRLNYNNIVAELDVDKNAGGNIVKDPQENIYLNGIPIGIHSVIVVLYAKRGNEDIPFTISVIPQDQEARIYNSLIKNQGSSITIMSFEYRDGVLYFLNDNISR